MSAARSSPILTLLQEITWGTRNRRTPTASLSPMPSSASRPRRGSRDLLINLPTVALFVAALSASLVFLLVSVHSSRLAALETARSRRVSQKLLFNLEGQFEAPLAPTAAPPPPQRVPFWAQDLANKHQARFAPILQTAPRAPAYMPIKLTKEELIEMRWDYGMDEKALPYFGSDHWMARYPRGSRPWFNSLATFHEAGETHDVLREHGWLGVTPEGKRVWDPAPMPPPVWEYPGGYEKGMKNGGFYLNLSDALPLDRVTHDNRGKVCSSVEYDYEGFADVSVVITFYNEPFSTLMRTVHSVLNQTPPPILREIMLVDDHSNLTQNNQMVEDYIQYLPKTKLMRLGERRGLVNARLAGARAARGEVLVVLDSHVEVNVGWLEPQLKRIKEQRNAIVFPQILAINPETFDYDTTSGIGCHITFRWSMQEQSSLAANVNNPSPVPSPSMAGGLFAVDREYFWFLGGYDAGFSMWGAENVEMGFRTWMCGGRLECTPCAMTYHIYRKKGHGYESPHEHIVRNRLRTARIWTDEYYSIAKIFVTNLANPDIGNLDEMIELKERLNCKDFQWFLNTIDKDAHDILSPDSIMFFGEVRNQHPRRKHYCLDTMSVSREHEAFGVFPCHGEGGTQSWVGLRERPYVVPVSNDRLCLSSSLVFEKCRSKSRTIEFNVLSADVDTPDCVQLQSKSTEKCLSLPVEGKAELTFEHCDITNLNQVWSFPEFVPEPVRPLEHSEEWLEKRRRFQQQNESQVIA
eukprot:Gregarina_sp_Pseudo_9__5479@NODE_69_length_4603_cov_23_451358_g64_i0_p1_GENE_NODE_69_length_4603_cov_23_451358_g64_i0NODE_69_length_4603_cov_23_451358_g64_i0_p1_ORF_typecomplete_len750_score136_23Glycos_transf_2/PF00535_26/1_2e24Glyco_tranf_2_3/PF13641_6/1_2e21Glyco_transf_7C/PF02709_14/7_6e14Glyco_tranf_2_2/PF10111_9/4_1e12Ricin_B_lectin/PF00652_22/1_1e08Glyco_transf_21/PF13506_6/2_5e05CDtoxinA/PF03498_14/0_00097_NODE_69_length_4603_cov_23_451358_g64_i0782327